MHNTTRLFKTKIYRDRLIAYNVNRHKDAVTYPVLVYVSLDTLCHISLRTYLIYVYRQFHSLE